jgi:predicted RNA binding protein YcfA (HicA-like mRNA interferase family)
MSVTELIVELIKRKEVKLKYTELERKLKKAGCKLVKENGKHPTWYSPITGKTFQTSHHKSEEVKPGTLDSIKRDAGID